MPNALVTGAAGFIGSNLCEYLLDSGWTVHGIDNLLNGKQANIESLEKHDGFTFENTDIRSLTVLEGVDCLFHQAAIPSVPKSIEDPRFTTSVNCTGTANVLAEAAKANVEKAVVASSAAVYGNNDSLPKIETMPTEPSSPYGLSKVYTEELALQMDRLYDIDCVALRYFNVFGPRQDVSGDSPSVVPAFITRMLDGKRPFIYGDGEQSRDFVYVKNVCRANILAAQSTVSGEVFNIGGGNQITINQLAEAVCERTTPKMDPIYKDARPGDVRHSKAGLERARERLRYKPEIGFEEGLDRTVEWYREQNR